MFPTELVNFAMVLAKGNRVLSARDYAVAIQKGKLDLDG